MLFKASCRQVQRWDLHISELSASPAQPHILQPWPVLTCQVRDGQCLIISDHVAVPPILAGHLVELLEPLSPGC